MKDKKSCEKKTKCNTPSITYMFKQQQEKNEERARQTQQEDSCDDVQILAVEQSSKYFENTPSPNKRMVCRKSRRLSLKRKSNSSAVKIETSQKLDAAKKSKSSPDLDVLKDQENITKLLKKNVTDVTNNDSTITSSSSSKHEDILIDVKDTADSNNLNKKDLCQENIMETSVCCKSEVNDPNIKDTETELVKSERNELLMENIQNDGNNNKEGDTGSDAEVPELYRIPYYLENFQLILSSVTEDEFCIHLFNEEDHDYLNKFNDLSEEGQKLYVRLFQRQLRWLRKDKIKYPKIAEDLSPILQELVTSGIILDEKHLADLETILQALASPELKELAKTLKLATQGQRLDIINSIVSHTKQNNITSFFKMKGANMEATVIKRARKLLGCCYKLEKDARAVFMRCMTLFSLHQTRGDEDEQAGGNQQIFQMLMSNIGRMVYPEYVVNRKSTIFPHRDDLLRFVTALMLESDMREALEKNDFQTSLKLYTSAQPIAQQILSDKDIIRHDCSMPEHLRVYTAGASYTRILSLGVETLQKLRQYQTAVDQLNELLSRSMYHPDYRGRWYDRLALNTEQHLKQAAQAVDICQKALSDPRVRTGHRYAILQRAQRICHSPSQKKLKKKWTEFSDDVMIDVQEAPKVIIEGRQIFQGVAGSAVWICDEKTQDDSDDVSFVKRVEDFALNYYHNNGYPQGIHGEGGTFRNLFGVFLWDIIYADIQDVFLNKYQSYPLDIISDSFYTNRQQAIEDRLSEIRNKSPQELANEVDACWEKHFNELCLGVSWERFEDCDHMKGLVLCLGGHVIAGIIERLAKDMRHSTGGGPDLTVWNVDERKVKMVEVKGPGDRLSTKQILWLDYLLKLGVDAEVCHVQAVGAKRLKKPT